jgi:putrescine transport system substrate-binding protein
MRRLFTALAASLAISAPSIAQEKPATDGIVSVANWSDDIDPGVLDDFTSETGIKVIYDTYDSNDTLQARLLPGRSGYDVVVVSAALLHRDIKPGLFQRLDHARLPHAAGLSADVIAHLAVADPGNQHAVNYLWFTAGLAYDAVKARQRLGGAEPAAALTSWEVLFKSELLHKFVDCGVGVPDDPGEMTAIALSYLKPDPQTRNESDRGRAAELVARLRPLTKRIAASDVSRALAKGEVCLAVAWAGDALQARSRARGKVQVGYVVPREGAPMGLDNLAIPQDAPHVAAAYRFIDFLLRPDIAARNSNATRFASAVEAARPLVEPALAADATAYPDAAMMKRLFVVLSYQQRPLPVLPKPGAQPRPKAGSRRKLLK